MLKSHQYLLEPRPSDRLRIGDCLVDLSLREIAPADASADPMRVTLKTIGVLRVLIAHAGKVVSREALLEWVWPDTAPTDDVVTQAITQLRKALREDREHPRYIDTVAKQGYRLIAPVEWLLVEAADDASGIAADAQTGLAANIDANVNVNVNNADADVDTNFEINTETRAVPIGETERAATVVDSATPTQVQTAQFTYTRLRLTRTGVVALSLVGLAIVGIMAWTLSSDRKPSSTVAPVADAQRQAVDANSPIKANLPAFKLLTSRLADEYRPTLSPDGSLLAYIEEGEGSTTSALWVQTTAPVPPRRLTDAIPDQWDMMPSWSPDGRQIAFIRENRSGCTVMAIPAAGGSARELGECLAGTRHMIGWYPDGSALIGAQFVTSFSNLSQPRKVEKALHRMALADGRWQRIAYERAATDEDLWPVVSPDGRWIVFQRNLSLGDLWRMPVAGGTPERLTQLRANFYGIAWTPDNRHLLFARYREGRVLLTALDLASRRLREFDNSGRESHLYPNVARNGSAVAFEIETSRNVMRRVDTTDASEAVPAESERTPLLRAPRLLETTGSNMMPSIAPDGRQLMFYSDRSAEMRLWWVDQDKPDSLRMLDGFVPVTRYPVYWDAQSQHALALGTGTQGMGVYEIDPQRGRLNKLPLPDADPVHIAYHSDPHRILVVADRGQGRLGLRLYDRRTEPWRVLAQMDDVAAAVVDALNRRIVVARMSSAELWQTDLDLQQAKKIDEVEIQRRNRTLTPSPEGVWVMDSSDECYWRWRLVATTASSTPRALCLGHNDWSLVGVSYDGRRRSVYLAMMEEMGSDIGLLPLSALGLNAGPTNRSDVSASIP
jgi:DNA-binding winged helix-turn-helix (wHTH) protein/Tol biopolymer transport system component